MARKTDRGYTEGTWAGLPNYVAEDGYASLDEKIVQAHVARKRSRKVVKEMVSNGKEALASPVAIAEKVADNPEESEEEVIKNG